MPHAPSDEERKAALRSQIDENLRRIYHTALEDAVPERFTRLLQQLRDTGGVRSPESEEHAARPPAPSSSSVRESGS